MSVHVVAGQTPVATPAESEIRWAPISSPVILHFNGTSLDAVKTALVEAFGSFPIRLSGGQQMFILRGMAIGAGDGSTPYRELATALAQFGNLEITLS